ncbi:Oxygen-independent coproporphyrinogen-III oxidase-like protein HemZ [bioreactor metagenome]|uniref:Oxygen-independent coproporphyrinogen-III oxidase-like protein HemZ n=1 Tax=bioreactor metagenome TaxID=1076179 RepID=A0A645JBW1_9ZZZZ
MVVKDMLDYADQALEANGYFPYYLYRQKNMRGNLENTGYAKQDTACRYNIVTMEENQSIIGAGAGSISKLVPPSGQIRRIANAKYPAEYLQGFDKYMEYKNLICGYIR